MPFPGEHLRVSQMWLERRNSGPKICTRTVSYKQRRSFPPNPHSPLNPPPSPLPPASDALLKTKLLHGYSRCTQHTGLLCVTNFPLYSSHLDFDFLAPSLVTVRQDSVCVHALQTLIYIHLHTSTYICMREICKTADFLLAEKLPKPNHNLHRFYIYTFSDIISIFNGPSAESRHLRTTKSRSRRRGRSKSASWLISPSQQHLRHPALISRVSKIHTTNFLGTPLLPLPRQLYLEIRARSRAHRNEPSL